MRAGEGAKLQWADLDLQRRLLTLNDTSKNGTPRIFNLSNRLIEMINGLPKKNKWLFGSQKKNSRNSSFYKMRKRTARKLENPRLLKIKLHTFRHWKATILYHETKDVLAVKEFLGHRSIDNTLLYIQTEKHLFKETNDNFIVKTARAPEEITALLEVGFQYICQKDSLVYFRKRK